MKCGSNPGSSRRSLLRNARPPSGPAQNTIKWIRVGAVSLVVKQPDHKADYTLSSSAEVTSGRSCSSTPPIRLNGL